VFFGALSFAMCRAMVLRAPLVSVEAAEDPATRWARALGEVAADLLALVAHARAVGLEGDEVEEAEDAAAAPVGVTELSRLRALQFRGAAARELAGVLRAAGHRSAAIAEWA
jgi:hypothetical protein